MSDLKMDAIDSQQQKEIDEIRESDKRQDFWLKILALGFVGWIMIITTIMMIRLTQMNTPDIYEKTEAPVKK